MKKIIVFIFAVGFLMLSGCNAQEYANLLQTHVEEVFYLGQSPEEVLNMFEREHIEPDGPMFTQEWDGFSYFGSDYVRVWFNPDNELIRINVMSPRFATDLDLRVGDNIEKMFELYGRDFMRLPGWYEGGEEFGWFFYGNDDLHLGFLVDSPGIVQWWTILIPSDQPSRP